MTSSLRLLWTVETNETDSRNPDPGIQTPAPPLPTKTYTTLVPIFAKKGVFFQWEARIREIKKKGAFCRHEPAKFWKRVTFCMYLLSFVRSACFNSYAQMYLSFNHNLKVMKNTTYIEKFIEFDAVTYIFTITKGYFSLYHEKIAFCFKKGCFIEPQNQWFRLKKGCFSAQIPRKGGVCGGGGGGGGGNYGCGYLCMQLNHVNRKVPMVVNTHIREYFLMQIFQWLMKESIAQGIIRLVAWKRFWGPIAVSLKNSNLVEI